MHNSSKEDLMSLQSEDENQPNPNPGIQHQLPHQAQSNPAQPNLEDLSNLTQSMIDRQGTPDEMRNFMKYWNQDKISTLKSEQEVQKIITIIEYYFNIMQFHGKHAQQLSILLVKNEIKRENFIWTVQLITKYQYLMDIIRNLCGERQNAIRKERKEEQLMRLASNTSSVIQQKDIDSKKNGQLNHAKALGNNLIKQQESFWTWIKQLSCCCLKNSNSYRCQQCSRLKTK